MVLGSDAEAIVRASDGCLKGDSSWDGRGMIAKRVVRRREASRADIQCLV